MEYNTEKDRLVISEYGRNVQNLINYAKTVEDKELRQKYAERIVALMYQMNPQNKNINNYRAKLWSHLLKIADYDIEVDAPEDSILTKEDAIKPEVMTYPKGAKRYRHYGRNVLELIKKATAMEDGPKKDAFAETIARYMKLAYRTWNREHYVSDELIIEDLNKMSQGKLSLGDNYDLNIGKDERDTNTRRHTNNNNRKTNYRKNNNPRYSNTRNKKRR
ncbi:DUF4290 domain-containing protein [Portibacter lacus]|nr:DUF4290 domain-containing protein [Portibacter lacus]